MGRRRCDGVDRSLHRGAMRIRRCKAPHRGNIGLRGREGRGGSCGWERDGRCGSIGEDGAGRSQTQRRQRGVRTGESRLCVVAVGLKGIRKNEKERVMTDLVGKARRGRVVGLGKIKKKDTADQQDRELSGDALERDRKGIEDPEADDRKKNKDEFCKM